MSSSNGHVAVPSSKFPLEYTSPSEEFISLDELKQLVRMLDQSDVVELEVKSAASKGRLVLRKASDTVQVPAQAALLDAPAPLEDTRYIITASLVGIFHPWSSSKDRPLAAVGDKVKEGQHVGMIQSLNIPSEVESPVAGRIVEFLVEDGQPVEYGQALIIIEQR
jgi:biotin carboxyl carrier protein